MAKEKEGKRTMTTTTSLRPEKQSNPNPNPKPMPNEPSATAKQILLRLRTRAGEIARKRDGEKQNTGELPRWAAENGGMPFAELPLAALYGEGKYPPPRKDFDDSGILALADSIRLHGLLTPLIVRPADGYTLPGDAPDGAGQYTVICGQRRLRALEILGKTTAPCFICLLPEEETAILSLCENIHRRPLSVFEQASAERALLAYATPDELSALLSLPASSVENRLPLEKLTPRERLLISAANLPEQEITALCRSSDPALRMAVLEELCRLKLLERGKNSVENLLSACAASSKLAEGRRLLLQKDLRLFYNSIDRAVRLLRETGVDAAYTVTVDGNRQTITLTLP